MHVERDQMELLIRERVFVNGKDTHIIGDDGKKSSWAFDFKRILFDPNFLEQYAHLFFEMHGNDYPFQIGGLESGALPLITALVMESKKRGTLVNGFYIRKSRKKSGTMNLIEGNVTGDPIILVDDLIHSGKSFLQQMTALDHMREAHPEWGSVTHVCAILQYKAKEDYYSF